MKDQTKETKSQSMSFASSILGDTGNKRYGKQDKSPTRSPVSCSSSSSSSEESKPVHKFRRAHRLKQQCVERPHIAPVPKSKPGSAARDSSSKTTRPVQYNVEKRRLERRSLVDPKSQVGEEKRGGHERKQEKQQNGKRLPETTLLDVLGLDLSGKKEYRKRRDGDDLGKTPSVGASRRGRDPSTNVTKSKDPVRADSVMQETQVSGGKGPRSMQTESGDLPASEMLETSTRRKKPRTEKGLRTRLAKNKKLTKAMLYLV